MSRLSLSVSLSLSLFPLFLPYSRCSYFSKRGRPLDPLKCVCAHLPWMRMAGSVVWGPAISKAESARRTVRIARVASRRMRKLGPLVYRSETIFIYHPGPSIDTNKLGYEFSLRTIFVNKLRSYRSSARGNWKVWANVRKRQKFVSQLSRSS